MLDETDLKILQLLIKDSRMQWREIGEQVHLTGQAVANRIRKLENMGVIEGFTLRVNEQRLGRTLGAFITVFMKTTDHESFRRFIKANNEIKEADQISGEGCYLLRVQAASHDDLQSLLNQILEYGNYRINISIGKVKG